MASNYGSGITTEGLVFCHDPKDKNCWDGSGTIVRDLVTASSGSFVSTITASIDNNGLDFDGVDDYIKYHDSPSNKVYPDALSSTEYTLELWANTSTTDDGGYGGLFGTGYPMQVYQLGGTEKITHYHANSSNTYYVSNKSTSAEMSADGTWWCYTLTRTDNGDGSSTSSTYVHYVDGNFDRTFTDDDETMRPNDGSGTNNQKIHGVHIGNFWPQHVTYTFGGTVGPVRVYDRALSAAEVLRNFKAQPDRFGI